MRTIIRSILIWVVAMLVPGVAMGQGTGGTKKKVQTTKNQTSKPAATKKTAKALSGNINGHAWVDLGLPSGTKWATCNIGASSSSDNGSYFAWGEISSKSEYNGGNSKTINKIFGDISANVSYDAARANWGGTWRMPSKAELDELTDRCIWVWITHGGKKGYKIIGPNGSSIFLPAAGSRYGSALFDEGKVGRYWSSSPWDSGNDRSYGLWIDESNRVVGWGVRDDGRLIRPVTK